MEVVQKMAKLIYVGILVGDLERSIKFYTKELRMKLLGKSDIKETGGKVAQLRSPGSNQVLELNWYPKGYKYGGKSGLDHIAFQVDDAKSYFEKLAKKHKVGLKPFREGRWVLGYVKDPDGNWIELGHVERKKKR
jgi:lactoylglutathione lyase